VERGNPLGPRSAAAHLFAVKTRAQRHCAVPIAGFTSRSIPHGIVDLYYTKMSFSLAPFAFALLQALNIYARIMGRDGLTLRPQFVSKAIAARLRAGVAALEAYLRRVLILMALEIEHELVAVERPENLARAKAKIPRVPKYSFKIYPPDSHAGQADFEHLFSQDRKTNQDATSPPVVVPIGHFLDRLDHLHALANDPRAKARRLAYSLARSRHGILMAPYVPPRRLHRWGREVSALSDAMAMQIMTKSRLRPPPLPPPRRGPKPMITVFW
jgi:hypothetical protein